MSISRPAVHPVGAAEAYQMGFHLHINHNPQHDNNHHNNNNNNNNQNNNNDLLLAPIGVRMRDVQGMPGTTGGIVLRILQFFFAIASLSFMVTTPDFNSVTAFRYLVAAVSVQSLWSMMLAVVDIYALLVKRSLRNSHVACLFTIGDGVTSTLTFAAACASAGITVLLGNDFNSCAGNHCGQFETATAMAFLSWFAVSPSFLLNFWTLASH